MTVKKLNRGVAVVGAGMSKFGAFPGFDPRPFRPGFPGHARIG